MLVSEAIEKLKMLPLTEEIVMIHFEKWEIEEELSDEAWSKLAEDISGEAEDAANDVLRDNTWRYLKEDEACVLCDSEECRCDQITDSVKED